MDDSHLIGGVEHRDIVVVDYNPQWPEQFLVERGLIDEALGPIATRVDHIGSTAVPGLPAKPIIDIQLSVPDTEDEDSYLPDLIAVGYLLRVRQPRHRMVRTPELDVQIHICNTGSDWERRHLLFRDWLRHNSADRAAYGDLKRDLARQDWMDMNAYADAKGPLISVMTERAEAWARATAWRLPQ
ncbi:MAG: GrpB family protein [Actinomycetota bacterium]|nr:GrpB family protein [Actinomycetota bacterium]